MDSTLSIIKADTGGFVGHTAVHPDMLAAALSEISMAIDGGLLIDGKVAACGDDISLIMTHRHGTEAKTVHSFAWKVFQETTVIAKQLGLYGAGQDLLSDAFSGNLRGMGPGYAELTFTERPSEPVICFLADKTEPGAWNLPLYKMFAVGEVLEPFAFPHSVAGCMRGSHHAPLMPVSLADAHPSRFDGPPRVVALGFQLHEGTHRATRHVRRPCVRWRPQAGRRGHGLSAPAWAVRTTPARP